MQDYGNGWTASGVSSRCFMLATWRASLWQIHQGSLMYTPGHFRVRAGGCCVNTPLFWRRPDSSTSLLSHRKAHIITSTRYFNTSPTACALMDTHSRAVQRDHPQWCRSAGSGGDRIPFVSVFTPGQASCFFISSLELPAHIWQEWSFTAEHVQVLKWEWISC